jgi:hypothetical protein
MPARGCPIPSFSANSNPVLLKRMPGIRQGCGEQDAQGHFWLAEVYFSLVSVTVIG